MVWSVKVHCMGCDSGQARQQGKGILQELQAIGQTKCSTLSETATMASCRRSCRGC